MDEAAHEIETHIDRTRARLSSNLKELEDKVEAAMDWREHVRRRPYVFLGAAVVGGALFATVVRPKPITRSGAEREGRSTRNRDGAIPAQAYQLWHNVQAALIGVAGARLRAYLDELVPGFEEHYRRAERGAGDIETTREHIRPGNA